MVPRLLCGRGAGYGGRQWRLSYRRAGFQAAWDKEKEDRAVAIEEATKYATEVPFQVMETAYQSMEVMMAMAKIGLQNSLSDAGVGSLCARTAVYGAYFNVRINKYS